MIKNDSVFKGWNTSKNKIINKFSKYIPELLRLNEDISLKEQSHIFKILKDFSNKKISEIIDNDNNIQEIIFNGYYIYEEPYSATYFYKGNNIESLKYIPYIITTGSGRSKGIYTLVLKPKNETF